MKRDAIPTDAWPPKLRPSAVPLGAREYISLAERYGLADDGYRDSLVESLQPQEVEELLSYLAAHPVEVEGWLCGPESQFSDPSNEYVAFTCLLMAADYARVLHGALGRAA